MIRYRRLPFWLLVLDLLGLFIATIVMSRVFALNPSSPIEPLYFVVAFILRVFWPERGKTKVVHDYGHALVAPFVAALLVIGLLAGLREYYSARFLISCAFTWSSLMLLGRALLRARLQEPLVLRLFDEFEWPGMPLAKQVDVLGSDHRHQQIDVKRLDYIAFDPGRPMTNEIATFVHHAGVAGVPMVNVATIIEEMCGRVPTRALSDLWATSLFSGESRYRHVKRVLDVAFTVLFSPLLLLGVLAIGVAVALDSGFPVFFRQQRLGLKGKEFTMLKFRTMRTDSEDMGAQFASHNDSRVTRLGQFMRRLRLDEIPQFWNVLAGDMSIIGPRPEQLALVETLRQGIPLYDLRHNVRPGITGWAQVRQGYAAGVEETRQKLEYDFYYVKHYSARLDVIVILKTIQTVLSGFAAR